MRTVVAAPQNLWEELYETLKNTECIRVDTPSDFDTHNPDDVYFNLFAGAEKFTYRTDSLIFINCVNSTLSECGQAQNVVRVNAWNGFLKREQWEIAGKENTNLLDYLNFVEKKFKLTSDVKGFVSCRIISMIINEAYFTLEEGVSSKEEIDTAMKLGTNYPKGPFEWSREIGIQNVNEFLLALSKEDLRYRPAPLLIKESASL